MIYVGWEQTGTRRNKIQGGQRCQSSFRSVLILKNLTDSILSDSPCLLDISYKLDWPGAKEYQTPLCTFQFVIQHRRRAFLRNFRHLLRLAYPRFRSLVWIAFCSTSRNICKHVFQFHPTIPMWESKKFNRGLDESQPVPGLKCQCSRLSGRVSTKCKWQTVMHKVQLNPIESNW